LDTSLFVKRFETGVTTDVTEDFTLPDYQPEIRRVVGVRATPAIDGKYLSGDELEADGGVTYTVLYVGGDGNLAQTSQTSSYAAAIPVKSEDDRFSAGDMVLGYTAEGVSCRVTGPRKFTLSCRVKHNLMSQRAADAGLKVEKTEGMTAPAVRRRTESHTTAALCEVRKSCEVSGEMREREGMRVIMAQGSVALSDVRVNQQTKKDALVKGDAYVSVLLLSPEGEYVTAKGRAPIEETVELPDISSADLLSAAAFGNVAMIEIEAAENGDLTWRMEYDIDCDVMKCHNCETSADAYLTGMDDKLTTGEFSAYVPACAVNGRLTTSGTAKLRPDMKYVCSWGSGVAERCDISGGRMTVYGSVKLSIVTCGEGEMITDEVVIPLKYECEAMTGASDASDGELTKRMQVNVTDIGVRTDGDTMNITAELAISAIALGVKPVTAVLGIAPADKVQSGEEPKRNVIRVYVPDGGETPWDVEKRFRLGKEATQEGDVYVI